MYICLHADSASLTRASSAQAAGNKWKFFLSHTQQNGDAKTLASTLFYEMKDRGYKCWLDVQMPKQDIDAMREGVENSEIVLAIITGGDDTKLRCPPICGSNHRLAEVLHRSATHAFWLHLRWQTSSAQCACRS